MSKRKALSKRVRFEVFKRDLFTCCYCGRKPPEVMLECDHVVPVCEGGADTIDNLTTACVACNAGKSGKALGNVAPALDEMAVLENMQSMLERRAVLKSEILTAQARREADAEALNQIGEWWGEVVGGDYWPNQNSVRNFLRRELPMTDILEAIEKTAAARCRIEKDWDLPRYFYGICWRMIEEMEGGAE